MNSIVNSLNGNKDYVKMLKDSNSYLITGLNDSAKALIALSACAVKNKSGIIILKSVQSAKKMVYDLEFFNDEYDICYLPSTPINYYNVSTESREEENQRINVYKKILENKKVIVVTTVDFVMQNVLSESLNITTNFKLKNSDKTDIETLVKTFTSLGYTRYDAVEGKGTFSVRGDIVDIFPVNMDNPCRIEFLFDEIDSIRTFDVLSQRSIDTLKEISVCQTEENLISDNKIEYVISKLEELLEKYNSSVKMSDEISSDIERLRKGDYKNLISKYYKLFTDKDYNPLEFFISKDFEIFIDEYDRLIEKSQNIIYENEEVISHLVKKEYIDSQFLNKYVPFEKIYNDILNNNKIYLLQKLNDISLKGINTIDFDTKELSIYRQSLFETLPVDISKNKDKIIVISVLTDVRKNQIEEILRIKKINYKVVNNINDINAKEAYVYLTKGIISSGFESKYFEFVIFAEPQSKFGEKIKKKARKDDNIGLDILSFEDLKVGDYIVHENHGIGKYLGIESINIQGVIKDYMKISYASNAALYIPVTQLDLIKKYDNYENKEIKLNSLNGKSWENTKSKVRKYVEEVAKDLVKLYAKRQRQNGFCFLKDSPWQKEFEDSFEYELTVDQKTAISQIKKDMESPNIMDRLLCGDVGYGKTEVALRVAFKAIMSGKQVAYLVPTTVLCLQQFNTFKSRMESFGVKVEMLCRFKTKKEQDKILKELEEGKIDVVVGTHRILSKDVKFKDLGLLIIDEEHRFGVNAKEQIKKMKENVDVLSMTATPIPRTLNMSLIGVRSMSNLTEPPIDRLPVHTYVMEYDETTISEAIKKELLRDGQVFYLSNKVDNIEEVTEKVRSISPKDARVAFAHGQMDPNQVEDIMIKFVNHEIDILVCTTILESGIDIPNANLIIVENADKLGLAQLYQIRGRVGRSNRLAYAYITYEKNKQITEISEKRLKAIKDFTEFGSGYKIALRDLELRGAGSLLGNMQHGHVMSVGYNMYLSMLERALAEEKGEKVENVKLDEVKIELDVSAYISDRYISNTVQKIAMYQKISDIKNNEDALDVIDELIDRYGELPREVENLIKIVEIRNLCRKIGVTKIAKKDNILIFEPSNLKYSLTNNKSNDILEFVQNNLCQIQNILENK